MEQTSKNNVNFSIKNLKKKQVSGVKTSAKQSFKQKRFTVPIVRGGIFKWGIRRAKLNACTRKLETRCSKQSIFFRHRKAFLVSAYRKAFRQVLLRRVYCRYLLILNRKNRSAKFKLSAYSNRILITGKKSKFNISKKFTRKQIRLGSLITGLSFYSISKRLTGKRLKKIKRLRGTFKPTKKYFRNFNKNPFLNLERFSFYKLFGYIKPKRRTFRRKGVKKFRKNYRGYSKYSISSNKNRFSYRQTDKSRTKKKPKNLVFKNKTWCVQIKKSDGRLIYRPLKLSDFLSSRSGWRTRTTSFKKKLPKSGRPAILMRFLLRSRNEYDAFVFRKRKIYNYYKRIYKYMGWKFKCYRSLFKKYSLSYHKYASFQNISNQFAWVNLSSRIIQSKASNLSDLFRNSAKYSVFSNSGFLWQLLQTTFINGALPSSFYIQHRTGWNVGGRFQNRPHFYNWNKKYRVVYNKNTMLNQQFKKPLGVYTTPFMVFKSSPIFSGYSPRFSNLLSNKQRHFVR